MLKLNDPDALADLLDAAFNGGFDSIATDAPKDTPELGL